MQSFLASFHFRLMIQSWFWIIHKCELNWVIMRLKQIRTLQSCVFSVLILKPQRLDWSNSGWPRRLNEIMIDMTRRFTIDRYEVYYGPVMQYLIGRRHACSYDFQNCSWLVWFDSILIQAKNKKEKMLTNRYSSRRQHNIKILQQELKSLKVQARFRTATTSGPFMICGRYWSETI